MPAVGSEKNPGKVQVPEGSASDLERYLETRAQVEPIIGERQGQRLEVGSIGNGTPASTMSYHQQGGPEGGRRQGPPYPIMGANGGAGGRAPAAGVYGIPQYGQVTSLS